MSNWILLKLLYTKWNKDQLATKEFKQQIRDCWSTIVIYQIRRVTE